MSEHFFIWYGSYSEGEIFDKARRFADELNQKLGKGRGVVMSSRLANLERVTIQIFSALYAAYYAMPKQKSLVSISLNRSDFSFSDPLKIPMSFTAMQSVCGELINRKWITIDKGDNYHKKKRSRIEAQGELKRFIKSLGLRWYPCNPLSPEKSIILRDRKLLDVNENNFKKGGRDYQKIELPLALTDEIKSQQEIIHVVNTCLSRHCFSLNLDDAQLEYVVKLIMDKSGSDKERSDERLGYLDFTRTQIKRIYSRGSTTLGGRFYHGWWQEIPSSIRQHILIDGYKTVEVDYSGMSLRLLYAIEGVDFPIDKDVYDLGFDGWKGAIDPRRKIIKTFINAAFNDEEEVFRLSQSELDVLGLLDQEELRERMYATYEAVNLQHHIQDGWGLKSTYLDSQIALKVLHYFALENIAVLPVHDSFIIRSGFQQWLEEVMKAAFKDVTKGGVTKTDATFHKPSSAFNPGLLRNKDEVDTFVPEEHSVLKTQEELKALVLRKYNLMEKYLSYWFLWNNRMH